MCNTSIRRYEFPILHTGSMCSRQLATLNHVSHMNCLFQGKIILRMHLIISIFLAFAISNLVGCRSAPIKDVENVQVSIKKRDYTLNDVEKAIMRAGTITSWHMEKDRPGVIVASFIGPNSGYAASVTIWYSTATYSIRFRNCSDNLRYGPGKIHENYNVWVKKLDEAIRREMIAY